MSRIIKVVQFIALSLFILQCSACGGGNSGGGTTVVSYNFDDNTTQGWSTTGLWHVSNVRSASGSFSMRYADPTLGTYETFDNMGAAIANAGTLTSPSITLGSFPVMSFDVFMDNECNADNGESVLCFYDRLTVLVSTDNGANFDEVTQAYAENSSFYTMYADLTPYAGQTVILRIMFDTDDEELNEFEGAYVDNIVVKNNSDYPATEFYVPAESGGKGVRANLDFDFDFMGSTYNDVYINPNGTLTFNSENIDTTQTVAELLDNAQPMIAAYWMEHYPNSINSGGIYYRRSANTFTIIFNDIEDNNNQGSFNDFEITLNSDGSVSYRYGTLDTAVAITGVSAGGGVADPGETDLSAATNLSTMTTVYEEFTGGGADDSDLANSTLNFSPLAVSP